MNEKYIIVYNGDMILSHARASELCYCLTNDNDGIIFFDTKKLAEDWLDFENRRTKLIEVITYKKFQQLQKLKKL